MHFIEQGEKDGRWPCPFFDPSWYANQYTKELSDSSLQPLDDFLHSGFSVARLPSKNFIGSLPRVPGKTDKKHTKTIAVIIHVYYLDMLQSILDFIQNIPVPFSLYFTVSLDREKGLNELLANYSNDYKIIVCPEGGYDISPFIIALSKLKNNKYDLICKIHTKKGDGEAGERWFKALLKPLLGSPQVVTNILNAFNDRKLGMIGSAVTYKSVDKLMYGNDESFAVIASVLGLEKAPLARYGFFAGTMFWARTTVFEDLIDNKRLDFLLSSNTHQQATGTPESVFHALERIFGILPYKKQMKMGLAYLANLDGTLNRVEILNSHFVPSSVGINLTLENEQKNSHLISENYSKECTIILGMHRSGTSVLTGLVSLFGLNLGSDLMSPTDDNPKGYFENNKIFKLNDQILGEHGSCWDDYCFTVDDISDYKFSQYVALAKEIINEDRDHHIEIIKDPRLCLLFPIWKTAFEELGITIKVIVVYRNPAEVAHSLLKRDGFELSKSYWLWAHYFYQLDRFSSDYSRLFIQYSKDFDDLPPLLNRLSDFISKPVTAELKKKAKALYTPSLNRQNQTVTSIRALQLPKFAETLSQLLMDKGLDEPKEIDKLRKRFYYSRAYIDAYRETQQTKSQYFIDLYRKSEKDNSVLQSEIDHLRVALQTSKDSLNNAKQLLKKTTEENQRLLVTIDKKEAGFLRSKNKMVTDLALKDVQLGKLESNATITENMVARLANDPVYAKKIKHILYGYPGFELKKIYKLIVKDKKDKQLQIEKALIAESGLFSPVYYLTNNPDIWQLGYDPLDSYCKTGWKEGRRPGPDFDPVFYWVNHKDVPRNINPLIHYIREGKAKRLAPVGISPFLERHIPPENLQKSGFLCRQFYNLVDNNIPHIPYTDEVLVSILVLNRNGVRYLQTLFPMLQENTQGINFEVLVVDNNSDDHSVFYMEQHYFDFPLSIIKNKKNESFSFANNQAAKQAKGKYLVLLNNDVEPTQGWLHYLLKEYDANNNTGAVGAKLIYPFKHSFGKSCRVQHAGIAFQYEGDFYRPYNMGNGKCPDDVSVSRSQQKSTLTAACLLVSKDAYFDVGGLDERYLYGYEDVDLGLKLYKKGYVNRYAANAVLFHHEFGTQDKDDQIEVTERRKGNVDVFRNKWFNFIKHAFWKEKIDGKSCLYAESRLSVAIVADHEDEVLKLQDDLLDFSWDVLLINVKTDLRYAIPEHVDVLINTVAHYDVRKIIHKNTQLICLAGIKTQYESWLEQEPLCLYKQVFVTKGEGANIFLDKAKIRPDDASQITYIENKVSGEDIRQFIVDRFIKTSIAIKMPVPEWENVNPWGDYHVAVMLKQSLEKEGYSVILQVLSEWNNDEAMECDVALVLRGLERYKPKPHQINIMWNISHPDMVSLDEYEEYDVVCIASDYWAKELKKKLTIPVEVVHQCTDTARFYPPTKEEQEQNHQELLFVGNSRGVYRKILKDLLPTDYDLKVIGGGWKDLIPHKYWPASYLDNKELSKYYGSADILLNDHWDDMREKGFVSNRLYDGLASGAFIISDKVRDMGEINDYICTYETADELSELIEYYLNHPEKRKEKVNEALVYIQRNHTFDNRAKQFSTIIKTIAVDAP